MNKTVIETKQKNHSWWIITLLTIVAVILTASLGVWQLNRASQKQALKNNIEAKAKELGINPLNYVGVYAKDNSSYHLIEKKEDGKWYYYNEIDGNSKITVNHTLVLNTNLSLSEFFQVY